MGDSWKELPLGKLYDFRSGLSKPRSEFGFGYGFLSFKDVFYNYFVPELLNELVNSSEKEQNSCSIQRGDVFLTRTSETMEELGMSSVALRAYPKTTFNGFTKRLRPKPGAEIVPEYAAYFFRSPKFRAEVTAMSSLSTRASLNNEMLGRLKMVLPGIDEQTAIGSILKGFDDKIELNRQMNQTLEAMARAIFKSWFVDFDPVRAKAEGRDTGLPEEIADLFPDKLEDSAIGEIPKGWNVGTLKKVASLKALTIQPKTDPKKTWEHYSIPAFDAGVQPLWEAGKNIKSGKYKVPKNSVLASKLNPQITRVWLPDIQSKDSAICSTEFMPFVPNDDGGRPFLYEMLRSHPIQCEILNRVTGSTGSRQRVKPKEIAVLPCLIPPKELVDFFCDKTGPLHNKQLSNIRESNTLTSLRDTLLPKLISGDLRGPDAEKFVKEAGL